MEVRLQGGGLAAHGCAVALSRRGVDFHWVRPGKPVAAGPVLVLNDVCLSLLSELFPRLKPAALGRALRGRVVRWADEPVARAHSPCLTVRTESLLSELDRHVPDRAATGARPEAPADWVVAAGLDTGLPERRRVRAGTRCIASCEVELSGLDPDWYYVESAPSGWLMLLPTEAGRAVLQVMLPGASQLERRVDAQLRASRLIGSGVRILNSPSLSPAAPYAFLPAAGKEWLGIGSSCMGLDPISGEGSPAALRGGMLAGALLGDLNAGRIEASAGLRHYEDRLALTFLAHLKGCAGFYTRAFGDHVGWREELRLIAAAHGEVLERVDPAGPDELRYELNDLRLVSP